MEYMEYYGIYKIVIIRGFIYTSYMNTGNENKEN